VLFIIVTGVLNLALNPMPSQTPSIGGGGYDLSKPVYTILLLGFTTLWSLTSLIISVCVKSSTTAKQFMFLAIAGIIATVLFALLYSHNLS
jgi:hypothetical protein